MSHSVSRHAQRKAETHRRLLNAAREVIAERGYHAVEILDITERANLGKATFYKHFANKEDCARALVQQGFDALLAEILSAAHTPPLSGAWVESSLRRIFEWAHEHRALLLIMVGGGASTALNAFGRSYMAQIIERTLLSDFAESAQETPIPPPLQAQIVTGILIQLLGWWLEHDTGYTAGDMARLVRLTLETGIAPATF